MTDRKKAGDTREGNAKGRGEGRERQARERRQLTGHPPIIIPDGGFNFVSFDPDDDPSARTGQDIIVEFDGVSMPNEHYRPGITGLIFTGRSLRKIRHVKVQHDQGWHTCLDSPTNCRIFVSERHRQTGAVKHIEIDATSDRVIDINFPDDYRNETIVNRKKMRGPLKKIRSLIILDTDGRLLHDCPEVRENRDCLICICDDCGIPCGD